MQKFKIEKVEGMEFIAQAVKDNNGYCPCALEKNEDTKCMCKQFREMETNGTCHCGLYRKIFFDFDNNL